MALARISEMSPSLEIVGEGGEDNNPEVEAEVERVTVRPEVSLSDSEAEDNPRVVAEVERVTARPEGRLEAEENLSEAVTNLIVTNKN